MIPQKTAIDTIKNGLILNKKKILIGAGVVVGGILLYQLLKGKRKPNAVQYMENQPPPTITKPEAKRRADMLFSAMDRPGTNEEQVFAALKGLTPNDFKRVYDEFGYKHYHVLLGTEGGSFFFKERDLIYWLSAELGDEEMKQLVKLLPDVFKI